MNHRCADLLDIAFFANKIEILCENVGHHLTWEENQQNQWELKVCTE